MCYSGYIINDLKSTLNESKDSELVGTIESTITKINESKVDHYNLYKLRKLNLGLWKSFLNRY